MKHLSFLFIALQHQIICITASLNKQNTFGLNFQKKELHLYGYHNKRFAHTAHPRRHMWNIVAAVNFALNAV